MHPQNARQLVGYMRHLLDTALHQQRAPQPGERRFPPMVDVDAIYRRDRMHIELRFDVADGMSSSFLIPEQELWGRRGRPTFDPLAFADALCHLYFEFGDVQLRGRDIYRVPEPTNWAMAPVVRADCHIEPLEMRTRNFSSLLRFEAPRNPAMSFALGGPTRAPRQREVHPLAAFNAGRPDPYLAQIWANDLRQAWEQADRTFDLEQLRRPRELARRQMAADMGQPAPAALTGAALTQFESQTPAGKKAWALLLEHLSADQRKSLLDNHYFETTGQDSGCQYKIYYGGSYNVKQRTKRGVITKLCFLPQGNLKMGDKLLAQKLALELNERGAIGVANRMEVTTW